MQKQAFNSNNLKKLFTTALNQKLGKQQRMKMQLDAVAIFSL